MLRSHQPRRAGSATIEFAVILPFLVFVLLVGTDFARLFYMKMAVDNCARAGAMWAADDDPSHRRESGYTDVTSAALAAAPNLSPTPTVTMTGPSSVTSVGKTYQVYKVNVSLVFRPTTSFVWSFTTLPSSITVSKTVEIRQFPS